MLQPGTKRVETHLKNTFLYHSKNGNHHQMNACSPPSATSPPPPTLSLTQCSLGDLYTLVFRPKQFGIEGEEGA